MERQIPFCIFAKPPVPAEVKTRLIPALGAEGAAQLAAAMLQDVWRVVEACPQARPVLATTRLGTFPVPVADGDVWLQGDGDLGDRLQRILDRALLHAPAAIALGADTPALTADHLKAALAALRSNDAVLGPATDGGFYLLALRRCPRGLFAALPWSCPTTLQALKSRLEEHSFSIAELEPLCDIDTPADLAAWTHCIADPATPATAARAWWLKTHANHDHSPGFE